MFKLFKFINRNGDSMVGYGDVVDAENYCNFLNSEIDEWIVVPLVYSRQIEEEAFVILEELEELGL